ncbi:MAG: aerotolerance regulator BatA, partial [Alistipes sp.]|nr:aerotolerance regulator BatA [Alistipes sp.]
MTFVKQPVEIDEKTLTEMADLTGGRYFRATNNEALRAIYEEINQLEKSKVEIFEQTTYTEEFLPWVILAMILLLLEVILSTLLFNRLP